MNARLQNRTALVTGSTDGIGSAVAAALAAEGAHVVVSGRDVARGEKVVAAIAGSSGRATFVPADLATASGVRQLADGARAALGGVPDILVNNAAMLIVPGPTGEIEEELVDAALAVNVKATILLTGLVAPAMAGRGSGAVVNMGSISGELGTGGSALYSATKAAIHSLTKSWADEYGPSGVRVNTVAPGPTLTDRIAGSALVQRHIEPLLERSPSRRASSPEEVARAVVFLVSDDAANIHGATLAVDGGRLAV